MDEEQGQDGSESLSGLGFLKLNKQVMGLVEIEENQTVKDLAYHIWALTAGDKRHVKYKRLTNLVALSHFVIIIGFYFFRKGCNSFLNEVNEGENMAVRIMLMTGVLFCSTYYARRIARVVHRAMFSFLRHKKAATFLSALLIPKEAAKFCLPFIDLTDLYCYPFNLFAWSELRHLILQQVVYVRSHRASVVIGVTLVTLVTTVAIGVIFSITSGDVFTEGASGSKLTSKTECDVGFYVTVLDVIILAMYLYRILDHVTGVNKIMRFHREKLSALKFVIEQYQWISPADDEDSRLSILSDDSSKNSEASVATNNWMRDHEIKRWVATRKAVTLLEALREHLEGRDTPVKVLGVEVDKTTVLQFVAFLFVCTMSQIVEGFSGALLFREPA